MQTKSPFKSFGEYCLRTPSLSIAFLDNLFESSDIKAKTKEVLESKMIREAIYLASPELFTQIKLWEQNKITNPKKEISVQNAILKYLIRMSSRSTPFGIFAGCSVGSIANETNISLHTASNFKKDTRFDMHFLVSLAKEFSKREHIKCKIKYYPNSTIYKFGKRYRFVEYVYENKKRLHSMESVLHSEYLEGILHKVKNGIKIESLKAYLINENIDDDDANNFINELILNQIIVSELEPTVTGKDFLFVLLDKLKSLENCSTEVTIIETLINYQERLSSYKTEDLAFYKKVNTFISSLNIDFEPKYLLQTDVYPKFKTNTISSRLIDKVKLGITILNKISKNNKEENLEIFKRNFNKRYEHQKKSLLEVLDIESGIGYGNRPVAVTPFLDDIKMPYHKNLAIAELSTFQEILYSKLQDCLINGNDTIKLSNDDFKSLNAEWKNAPDTISVMTEIIRQNGEEKIFMDVASAHASRLLARFASGNSKIKVLTNTIIEKETKLNPNTVIAEIVHIPESRTGNILRRPHLRKYEIPCLGFSSLPIKNQISLDDILVSVEGNTIMLTQASTGKRILPRLSNAHNYSDNPLSVYHFLCDLQYQNQRSYYFDWGSFMNKMIFLPRVMYKNLIFSKARWKIEGEELVNFKILFDNGKSSLRIGPISAWREKLKLPQFVELVEGDNTLYIDLECHWSTQILYNQIKSKKRFILQEIYKSEEAIVKKGVQTYKNEVVFSFFKEAKLSLN